MDYPPHLVNLDLCVLAYHLYHQSLVWPLDPWYESIAHPGTSRRTNLIAQVRAEAETLFKGASQLTTNTALNPAPDHATYSGTQMLRFGSAPSAQQQKLDPILTNYSRLDPRYPALTHDDAKFILIKTPPEITNGLGAISLAHKTAPGPAGNRVININQLPGRNPLVAFEGGTGGLGDPNTPVVFSTPAWSVMGFVTVRQNASGGTDVHIAFRGSRSGSAGRAIMQGMKKSKVRGAAVRNAAHSPVSALSVPVVGPALAAIATAALPLTVPLAAILAPGQQSGNPDWVTDMDNMTHVECPRISKIGKVGRGFAKSVLSCLETILLALGALNIPPPENIYVTGHSLGAALATSFTSAVVLGTFRDELTGALAAWPWSRIQCICYALPVVGDAEWAAAFNLVNQAQVKNIWVTGDNVVTGGRSGAAQVGGIAGHHPGISVELAAPTPKVKDNPHELYVIRGCLLRDTAPPAVGTVHDMLKVDASIRNGTPWAYYKTFANLMAGTAFSYRPPGSAAANLVDGDGLRTLLRKCRFAEEWARYIHIYGQVISHKSSYRMPSIFMIKSWLRARQAALLQTLDTVMYHTRLSTRPAPPLPPGARAALAGALPPPPPLPPRPRVGAGAGGAGALPPPPPVPRPLSAGARAGMAAALARALPPPPPVPVVPTGTPKAIVLGVLEQALVTLNGAIGGTANMQQGEFDFLALGFSLLVYTRRSDILYTEIASAGTFTTRAFSSTLATRT